jgi:glycosyltransferase involved in cell wall biosynthesis
MDILIYNIGYNRYSGGVYYVDGLACAMAQQGHNVTLLEDGPNVSSFNLNFPNLEKVISKDFTPPEKHYDVVLSIHQHPMVYASRYAESHRIPFIPIIFELPNFVRQYIPQWSIANDAGWEYIKEPLRIAASILCLSRECIKYIHEFVPETHGKKVHVIEGIINNHDARCAQNGSLVRDGIRKHVCWVGFSSTNKNVQDLISAVAKADSKWIIDYITPVQDASAVSLAARLRVSLNMIVSPDDTKKFEIINNSDLVVSTSKFEGGICMSILEGMYAGKPIISYDLPLHKDVCGDRITNVPADTGELAKALSLVSAIPQIETNHKFIEDNFTIEAVGKRMNNILDEYRRPRIGVYMGVLNEGKFIRYALEPFLRFPYIRKIVITEACDKLYPGSHNGLSVDDTANIIKKLQQEYPGKIEFMQLGFVDSKTVYQNAGIEALEKHDIDWVIKTDGDEVYKMQDLYKILDVIKSKGNEVDILKIPQVEFWKYPDLIATGSLWGYGKLCIFKMSKGIRHKDPNDTPITGRVYDMAPEGVKIYHYGAMKGAKDIEDKLEYYKSRDEARHPEITVKNTWDNWKKGEPTMWTHTMQQSGAEKFTGAHPINIRDFIYTHPRSE